MGDRHTLKVLWKYLEIKNLLKIEGKPDDKETKEALSTTSWGEVDFLRAFRTLSNLRPRKNHLRKLYWYEDDDGLTYLTLCIFDKD